MQDDTSFKINNFDLIRLFAALQVALSHSAGHLQVGTEGVLFFQLLALFPGVPIFFFISGFLISKSFESNSRIKEYAQNRILRIYPGLICCVILSIIAIWSTGHLSRADFSIAGLGSWIVTQISFFQFYNPDFMRSFGVGVFNGSLWTISVELQFYILVPIIYVLFGLGNKVRSKKAKNIILLVLIGIFLSINRLYHAYSPELSESIIYKLVGVSFTPWFYMFMTGILFQKNYDWITRYLSGKFMYVFIIYFGISFMLSKYFGAGIGNDIGPLLYAILCLAIFSGAFSRKRLAQRLLNKNDISYGIYIYHMPVVNMMIFYGYTGNIRYFFLAVFMAVVVACLSWMLIEKPCLKLKRHPLNPLSQSGWNLDAGRG